MIGRGVIEGSSSRLHFIHHRDAQLVQTTEEKVPVLELVWARCGGVQALEDPVYDEMEG